MRTCDLDLCAERIGYFDTNLCGKKTPFVYHVSPLVVQSCSITLNAFYETGMLLTLDHDMTCR